MYKKVLALCVLVFFMFPFSVSAAPISAHAIACNGDLELEGSAFQCITEYMDGGWNINYKARFILNGLWLRTDTYGSWIECGYTDGGMKEPTDTDYSYHHGFYTAECRLNVNRDIVYYREYKVFGPSTSTGKDHSYKIQKYGNLQFGVYIDYVLRKVFNTTSNFAELPEIGAETNDDVSSLIYWNSRNFYNKKNSVWSFWTTGSTFQDSVIDVWWNTEPTSITCVY